jgi:hypothetical protein
MLTQGAINMFRVNQMIQDKAQFENNGQVLVESYNAVLDHLVYSLRASREAVVCGVAPFGKDQPFPARRALHPTTSRFAEPVNSALREH